MKRIKLVAVFAFAAAIGGYHYFRANNMDNLSNITRANIEALADWHPSSICYQVYVEDSYAPIALEIVPCDNCKETIWVISCSSRSVCYN